MDRRIFSDTLCLRSELIEGSLGDFVTKTGRPVWKSEHNGRIAVLGCRLIPSRVTVNIPSSQEPSGIQLVHSRCTVFYLHRLES
jgi:hypothetical protein